jgi:hypothetical protein
MDQRVVALLAAVSITGCARRPMATLLAAETGLRARHCPSTGAVVSFMQLTSQAERFVGCEVTTTVGFVAAGIGAGYFLFEARDQTVFRVVPPGRPPLAGDAWSSDAQFAAVADERAGPIFAARAGQRLQLRGHLEYRRLAWVDEGNFSRLFRASSVELE